MLKMQVTQQLQWPRPLLQQTTTATGDAGCCSGAAGMAGATTVAHPVLHPHPQRLQARLRRFPQYKHVVFGHFCFGEFSSYEAVWHQHHDRLSPMCQGSKGPEPVALKENLILQVTLPPLRLLLPLLPMAGATTATPPVLHPPVQLLLVRL